MSRNIHLAYNKLLTRIKDLIVLKSAQSLIHWDMETMMPPRAVELRSQQLVLLSRIEHKMSTAPEIGRLIKRIKSSSDFETFDQIQKRNMYLMEKNYEEQTHLPEKLVAETTKQQVLTVNSWKKAKSKKDFGLLKSDLEKLVELNKKIAEILMKVKKVSTQYNALIDNYEPKIDTQTINRVFSELQNGLKPLLNKIQNCSDYPHEQKDRITISIEKQRKIAQLLTQILGYDTVSSKSGGRIDETEHPFTTGYYDDVRITTHYYPRNYISAIFSVLHETGHALYEQNINQVFKYQPLGSISSYGFHESQSRLYENIIGRSREFWSYSLPKLKQITTPLLDDIGLDQFFFLINHVKPSKIRIEADEVTYNLHIIIRYQIEMALFENKIEVQDLPGIWNQKYGDLLGLKIENDTEGVMQDTHWASGYYGYFPSYAIGNIYSGQIFKSLKENVKNYNKKIELGELEEINHWLKQNVQGWGSLYEPNELIKKISGEKISAQAYIQYLDEKYRKLYHI
ncbi:MAG: carboxypeptidase M32 [Candidatus Bathyarchaeota archaeon]|nr:carboxypeptidase M32 [Candidatus Bathyarchaeota archaeon]